MSDLLLLTPQLPYPPHQGTSLRNFYIIRGLAERHRITLLSFMQDGQTEENAELGPLPELCQRVVAIATPQSRTMFTRLRQMLLTRQPDMALRLESKRFEDVLIDILQERPFDIVQVEGIEMAWTIEPTRRVRPAQKIIYDAHNVEALLQQRALRADLHNPSRWLAAGYSWVQQKRLRKFEIDIGEQVDWITAVSHIDQDTLAQQLGGCQVPISVIPNSIDISRYLHHSISAGTEINEPQFDVVFIGKMDYRPNIDAVLWFANNVWPLILAKSDGSTWAIVGQKPHARLDCLREMPGVTVTGWVEEVQPYLAGAKVVVMPFRVGSGTRLKLIEALAAGKAVVSTTLGVEGYPVQDRKELLLADEPGDMAQKILHLLRDTGQREQLGQRGQEFAEQYDWRAIIPLFDDIYTKLTP